MMPQKNPCSRYFLFLAVAVLVLLVDLATKSWAFAVCGLPGEKPVWWWIPNVMGVQTSLNEGALFGMGQGFSWFFSFFSLLALVVIVAWLFWTESAKGVLTTIVGALFVGGALGNTFDRIGLHQLLWQAHFIPWINDSPIHQPGEPVYAVRDWILVMIGSYHWPNFNIADSCLVVGLILAMVHILFFADDADEKSELNENQKQAEIGSARK